MKTAPPLCLYCGKALRRYRWRADGPNATAHPIEMQWGDYGDNHFCGQTCGYQWAIMWLKREQKYAAELHEAMLKIAGDKP